MRELFPEELHFIQFHLGRDMTAREIATYFGVDPARIHEAADELKLRNANCRPTAMYTPYPTKVAVHVRKATRADADMPVPYEFWQQEHGLRP